MRRIALVLKLFLLIAFTLSVQAADQRKRIAVLDFDFAGVQRWWGGYNWDIGAGIADIVINDLVEEGSFRVIERRAINDVLAEQEFSNSDRADPSTAARIGKLLGVDAIVIGSITQFGAETKERSIGGIGGGWGGFGGAKVGTSEGKANVAINARVVNVETGEILAVARGEGDSSRSGLLLGGSGGGHGGFGSGEIDMRSSDFRETILGEATYEAAREVARGVTSSRNRIPAQERVLRGLVAYAADGTVILNIGSDQGVEVGMELSVERVSKTIKDPATGRVLRELTDPVATIRVTQVDAASAEASIVSGSGIRVGDTVRN